jgi:cytochrome c556
MPNNPEKRMIRSSILASVALGLGLTVAFAQGDPIAPRREGMKGVGAATRIGTQMTKGEVPFDAATAKEILRVYAEAADRMHNYFPETSKTGGETTAAPKIWEDQAAFRKRFDDWSADIKTASAQTNDLESFRVAFGNVTKACGGCHETYRIKK